MSTYREEAVVLRKLDYGEADRIYTLLTKDHGKIGAIARGVRRSTSKLASALEVYSQVDVQLAHGRNLDVIAQVVRKQTPRIEADLERTSRAALIAELAERMTEDRHPIEDLYELTCWALNELAVDPEPRRAGAFFLSAALEMMGYAPQLSDCASCGRPLAETSHAFSAASGGFLCSSCADPAEPAVSPGAIKVLRVMFRRDVELYRRLKLSTAIMDEVDDVLADQLEYHLDKRLNSLRFLRRMRGAGRAQALPSTAEQGGRPPSTRGVGRAQALPSTAEQGGRPPSTRGVGRAQALPSTAEQGGLPPSTRAQT